MRKTFVRALLLNAAIQFAVTRHRAGQAIEEGEAEMMWLRYPAQVLLNAIAWTLMLALARRIGRAVQAIRAAG